MAYFTQRTKFTLTNPIEERLKDATNLLGDLTEELEELHYNNDDDINELFEACYKAYANLYDFITAYYKYKET